MSFQASLFDPRTGNSVRAMVEVSRLSIDVLTDDGETLSVSPDRCRLKAGGWDDGAIQILWSDEKGSWALHTKDAGASAELARIEGLANDVAEAGRTHRGARTRGGFAFGLVLFVVSLPLIAVALVYFNRDALVDAVLKRLPLTVDQEIGRLFEGELTDSSALPASHDATGAVNAIVQRLRAAQPNAGFEFKVSVQK